MANGLTPQFQATPRAPRTPRSMRSVLLPLALLVSGIASVSAIGAPLLRPPQARAVPITEGTEPPGNPPDNYSPCTVAMLTPFYSAIYSQANECRSKTTYNWDASDIPSTAEREQVCSCELLIQKLQRVQVPHCLRSINNVWCRYALVLEYKFGLCDSERRRLLSEWPAECSATPEPTNPIKTATPSPAKTMTVSVSPVRTPSPEPTDPPVITTSSNTGAIVGGSVASAVSVGIVVTITLRCRRKRHDKKHTRRSANSECEEIESGDAAALATELLSPLGDPPSSTKFTLAQTEKWSTRETV